MLRMKMLEHTCAATTGPLIRKGGHAPCASTRASLAGVWRGTPPIANTNSLLFQFLLLLLLLLLLHRLLLPPAGALSLPIPHTCTALRHLKLIFLQRRRISTRSMHSVVHLGASSAGYCSTLPTCTPRAQSRHLKLSSSQNSRHFSNALIVSSRLKPSRCVECRV